jgi:hypothetical protein
MAVPQSSGDRICSLAYHLVVPATSCCVPLTQPKRAVVILVATIMIDLNGISVAVNEESGQKYSLMHTRVGPPTSP